jgi:hypothetical protein
MNSRSKSPAPISPSATIPGPKPGDFSAGSLRSRAAARAAVEAFAANLRANEQDQLGDLPPFEQAIAEAGETAELKIQLVRLARAAKVRARIFGLTLPSPDEIRHNQRVAREIDRLTDGSGSSLAISNPREWNRLKAIAERNLQRENRGQPPE